MMAVDTKYDPVMIRLRKQWLENRKIAPFIAEDLAAFLDDAPEIHWSVLDDAVRRHVRTVELYGEENPPPAALADLSDAVATVLKHCFRVETTAPKGFYMTYMKM